MATNSAALRPRRVRSFRPRSAGVAYIAIAAIMAVLVSTMALRARVPSVPSAPEFSPKAAKPSPGRQGISEPQKATDQAQENPGTSQQSPSPQVNNLHSQVTKPVGPTPRGGLGAGPSAVGGPGSRGGGSGGPGSGVGSGPEGAGSGPGGTGSGPGGEGPAGGGGPSLPGGQAPPGAGGSNAPKPVADTATPTTLPGTTSTTAPTPTTTPGADPTPTTTTTTPTVTTTTTLPPGPPGPGCFGPSPYWRQINDPQSPPCVAPYDGQNANLATSKGIESDGRINIGISPVGGGAAQKPLLKEYSDIAAYFNSHFNFWGRKLNFVPISSAGSSNFGPNPAQEQQRADDVVAGESGPYGANFFATVSNSLSLSQTYYDVLAKNKVITVDNREPLVGEDHFRDPNGDGDTSDGYYEWSYMPGFDVIGRNLGDWICKQVPHGPADKALNGGAAESLLARKFGYVVHTFADEPTPDTGPLDTALAGCGISVPPKDRLKFQYAGGAGEDYAAVESGLVNLRADNVTSIICVCMTASLRLTVMPAATNQSYFPEWLVSSYGQNDFDQYISDTSGPPEQMAHAYGISFRSEWSAVPSLPVDQAVKGADPTHTWPQADGAGFQSAHYWQAERYPGLLMLAAGIQMAGPNLTPQTFAHGMQEYKGLQGTNFPNPPTPTADGTNQYHAAKVGFRNDHTMVDDAAVIWYSPTERSFWNNGEAGTWCFSAERHSISDPWPAANQPFDRSKPCRPDT